MQLNRNDLSCSWVEGDKRIRKIGQMGNGRITWIEWLLNGLRDYEIMDRGVRKCSRHKGRNRCIDGWRRTSGWMGGKKKYFRENRIKCMDGSGVRE